MSDIKMCQEHLAQCEARIERLNEMPGFFEILATCCQFIFGVALIIVVGAAVAWCVFWCLRKMFAEMFNE